MVGFEGFGDREKNYFGPKSRDSGPGPAPTWLGNGWEIGLRLYGDNACLLRGAPFPRTFCGIAEITTVKMANLTEAARLWPWASHSHKEGGSARAAIFTVEKFLKIPVKKFRVQNGSNGELFFKKFLNGFSPGPFFAPPVHLGKFGCGFGIHRYLLLSLPSGLYRLAATLRN